MSQSIEKNHSSSEEVLSSNPSRKKDLTHRQQSRILFFKFLRRWLLTAGICVAFVVVLREYDRKSWMEDGSTHIYNAVVSGLTICLSLNIDASLNAFAAAFKWVILASKQFNPHIFELILAFDNSKVNAIKLIFWRKVGAWWLRAICIVWLFITLAAQVGTALIGLTYSVIPLSPDRGDFPKPHGYGRTSIFTQIGYYDEAIAADQESNLTTQRSNAFDYGVGAINSGFDDVDSSTPFTFRSASYDYDKNIFIGAISNYPGWASDSLTQWNFIGRYVENQAWCEETPIRSVNSSSNITDITFDGYNGTQIFTIPQTPLDYITYISDTSLSCGPRCTQVYAIYSTDETTDLFSCNSTVYEMLNQDWHPINRTDLSIPDTQAQILAGAIGWGDIKIDNSLDGLSMPGRYRASSFSNGSYWAPYGPPTNDTISSAYVAYFTASTIAVIDEYGIQQNFTDLVIPGMASELTVTWKYSILILALIPGIQALLALLCVLVVYLHKVPIHDGSLLGIAALLNPALSEFAKGDHNGRDIAKHMDDVDDDLQYVKESEGGSQGGKWVIKMIKQ
ncbi:hypothetical protein F4805DRAFT_433855 [Annulohypoxylon moriforme]|nr:hypothetical protein F4805DRAFT_433855 [Annulohypoxylon moriforme]